MIKCCKTYVFFVLSLLLFSVSVSAQTINNPKLGFQFACATKTKFNSFNVKVSYSGYSNTANSFILELSDAKGSFRDKTEIKELKKIQASGTSSVDFNFAIPNGVFGEQYRVRVRSTHPAKTSSYSQNFAAYLLPSSRPILNDNEEKVFLCGSNASKEVQITFEDATDASTYKYEWFKDEKPYKEGGSTLVITEKGVYSAKISLKKGCTNNISESNWVSAEILGASESVYLNNKEDVVELCADETYSFKASVSDKNYEYRWYKDKKIIENSSLYVPELTTQNTEQFGVYYLVVKAPNGCEIKSQEITIKEKQGSFEVAINGDLERELPSGQSINLQASVSEQNETYTYQWFKNNEPLLNEKSSELSVSTLGDYFVKVTQGTGSCAVSVSSKAVKVVNKTTQATVIPNILSPFNADGVNDVWELPNNYRNPNIRVVIYDVTGKEIFSQLNYQNNWPEAGLVKAGKLYYFRIFEGENVKKSGTISIVE